VPAREINCYTAWGKTELGISLNLPRINAVDRAKSEDAPLGARHVPRARGPWAT